MKNYMTAARAVLACGVLAVALPFLGAQSASASTIYVSNNCGDGCTGQLYLYYNSNEEGGSASIKGNVADYTGSPYVWVFGAGNGAGQAVKNNAASAENNSSTYDYTIYYNSNYQGASQTIGDLAWENDIVNLDSTLKNNNASQQETN